MTDTQLLDLLESGKVNIEDLYYHRKKWHYWSPSKLSWPASKSLRDCIRKLAELKEKK